MTEPLGTRSDPLADSPVARAEDLGAQFLASREDEIGQSAAARLMERVHQRRQPTEPGGTSSQGGSPPQAPVPGAGRLAASPAAGGGTGTASKMAADVGQGLKEAPAQALAGALDAGQAVVSGLDDLGDWLNQNVADLSVAVPGLPAWLGNPLSVDLPTIAEPESVTGDIVRTGAQFLVGLIPALKAVRAAGVGAGTAGRIAEDVVAAALADFAVFEGSEANLADLWKSLDLPENALADFLASDPADSEAEARFKNALAAAPLGAIADGIVTGARVLRDVRAARGLSSEAVVDPLEAARAEFGEVGERDFMILGDPNDPLFQVRAAEQQTEGVAAPEQLTGGVDVGLEGGERVFINFARIDEPEDVQSVMGQMADLMADEIDVARRGTMSQEQTAALADEMGLTVQDLLARRQGQPLNAEESLAARRLWAASGEKLLETARAAAALNAGPVDQFNFRRMMALHHAIQAQVVGARTETARALAAWKIPAGGGVEQARSISQVMDAMGGPDASREMARRLAILAEAGAEPGDIAAFAARGWAATGMDAVKEVWVNGLLSSPKTHIVNITSNTMVAFQQIYERKAAEWISQLAGRPSREAVATGEAAAMTYGLIEAQRDAFRLAWKALKTGETGQALGKIDLPRRRAVSAEAFDLDQAGAAGRTVDFLGNVFRVPGRLLGAEDEFFKTIGYRMELHAQALRQATEEGLEGAPLATRMRELRRNPPEHLRIAAADAALYNTFTNQAGAFGRAVMRTRDAASPLTFILPFVRTPINIARYAFERSPVAPFVAQWRRDIAAGGAQRDLALARMATGTSIMLLAMDMADGGLVTGRGPKDSGEREALLRQGWQPYSIKFGERWASYNRADPFGMTMGFAADIAEAIHRGEVDDDAVDEWQEITAMAIASVAQVTINKTYLSGFAEFMEMMSDPSRYTEGYVNDFIASFVPATSLMGAVSRFNDPVLREIDNPSDAITARILGMSDQLWPRRDLWGEEVRLESGLGRTYDFFAPWTSRTVKKSPIDAELERQGAGIRRIRKKTSFAGVDVNFRDWPAVYDQYTRLAGNALKLPATGGLGLREFLDDLVEGRHALSPVYDMKSDGKDGMKIAMIRDWTRRYREAAQRDILADPRFARFADHIDQLAQEKLQRRLPRGVDLSLSTPPAPPAGAGFAQQAPAGGAGRANRAGGVTIPIAPAEDPTSAPAGGAGRALPTMSAP